MNDLQIFNFGQWPVRAGLLNSEPVIVAADICNVLGLGNVTMAIARLEQLA